MAEAMPVRLPKQSDRLAAQLNSPPLTWIWHSVALRKGTMPGSRRWMMPPRARKSNSACWRMFRPSLMLFSLSIALYRLRVVGGGGHPASRARPVGVEELAPGPVHPLVGVGAEEVPLGLEQVGGQPPRAVAVVEGQGRGEGRGGHPILDGMDHGAPPGRLVLDEHPGEEVVQQQVGDPRFLIVGLLDLAQEAAADDAAPPPHQGDAAEVQLPAVLLGRLPQQHVALGVGDDLGAIEGPAHLLYEGRPVVLGRVSGPGQHPGRRHPLLLEGGEGAGEDRLADEGDGHPSIQGGDHRPLAGALLARGVQDLVHQGGAVLVLLGEDLAGDLDEVAVQLPLVPLGELLGQLVGGEAQGVLEQLVGLADQLHVAILDAVVDHLHEVAGAALSHPVAAGGAVLHLGGHGPSIMPGGNPAAWPHLKEIFQAVAAKVEDGTPCCDWVGEGGAGHFVKMVHNGIEYGDMQIICEAYQLMKEMLGMNADEMHDVFKTWNEGDLDSYLIEITRDILGFKDEKGEALVEKILDTAGQKGTGKWTAVSALDLGIPCLLYTSDAADE